MSVNRDPVCEPPTHKECVRRLWSQYEPPKDGRFIVAIGRVIYRASLAEEDDGVLEADAVGCCTCVDSFVALIHWSGEGRGAGWHYPARGPSPGLSVARTLDDEVVIDFWLEDPR